MGFFDYDADTNTLSNVTIVTTERTDPGFIDYYGAYDGARFAGACDWICSSSSSWLEVYATDGNDNYFELFLDGFMTNAGGTLQILSGGEYDPEPGGGQGRGIISGSISTVPVPAAVWLFGSALAGLGWMKRKHTA